jgi:hypothetical protein
MSRKYPECPKHLKSRCLKCPKSLKCSELLKSRRLKCPKPLKCSELLKCSESLKCSELLKSRRLKGPKRPKPLCLTNRKHRKHRKYPTELAYPTCPAEIAEPMRYWHMHKKYSSLR